MNNQTQNLSLIERYREMVALGELRADPAQNLVIEKLSLLATRLARPQEKNRGFASAIFGWGREPVSEAGLRGEYIYGSVGTGKSMVMQLFVEAVGDAAWRVHFLEFMEKVQKDLNEIQKTKTKDPLDQIAKQISQNCRVLCLDEMQVENIADAMIIGRLFEGIFSRGVVLVTTSNRHPDDLYKGGLNRHRFTPFIAEIKSHCEIVSLDNGVDYRQGDGGDARYFVNDEAALDKIWNGIEGADEPCDLKLKNRLWPIEHSKPGAARIEFHDGFEEARGAQDYQALVDRFDCIFIDHMPVLTKENTSAATRFVKFIDVAYEAKTVLYLGLNAPLDAIHQDPATKFIFERTMSRLQEMQRVKAL